MPTATDYNSARCIVGELASHAVHILNEMADPSIDDETDQRLCDELLSIESQATRWKARSAAGVLFQISLLGNFCPGMVTWSDYATLNAEIEKYTALLESIRDFIEHATGVRSPDALTSEYVGRDISQAGT